MGYALEETMKEAEQTADQIKNWNPALTRSGVYYNNAHALLNMIRDLKETIRELSFYGVEKKIEDFVDITSLHVAGNYKEIVSKYSDYPIWACDFNGWCLVGETLDEVESIDQVEQNVKRDEYTKHHISKIQKEKNE